MPAREARSRDLGIWRGLLLAVPVSVAIWVGVIGLVLAVVG